jgi:hypothetical protein
MNNVRSVRKRAKTSCIILSQGLINILKSQKQIKKLGIQSFQAIGSRFVIIPRFNFLKVVVVMGLKLTRNLHNILNYLLYTIHRLHNSKHEPCKTQNDKPHEILPFQGYQVHEIRRAWGAGAEGGRMPWFEISQSDK